MNVYAERDRIAAERAAIDESALSDDERRELRREWRDRLIGAALGSVPAPKGYRLRSIGAVVEIGDETIVFTGENR